MTFSNDHAKGLILTTLGVLVLTPDALLIRLIAADTWTLVFWRGLLMGISLALFVVVRNPGSAVLGITRLSKIGWLGALLFGANNILFMVSITHTTAANTLVILGAMPLFAAILGLIFIREHLPLATWGAIIIGFAGILIIFMGSLNGDGLFGDLAAAATACGMAGALICLRHEQTANSLVVICIGAFISAGFAFFMADTLTLTGTDPFFVPLLGAVVLPLAMGLITIGPSYIPAAEVALLMLLEMALGPLWVWLGVGEIPTDQTMVGGTIVLITLGMHSLLTRRENKPQR